MLLKNGSFFPSIKKYKKKEYFSLGKNQNSLILFQKNPRILSNETDSGSMAVAVEEVAVAVAVAVNGSGSGCTAVAARQRQQEVATGRKKEQIHE